jgi:ABC-type multidrug transport system fused ATPase/permease subunit
LQAHHWRRFFAQFFNKRKNTMKSSWLIHLRQHKAALALNAALALANVPLTLLSVLGLAFAFKQLNTSPEHLRWDELVGSILGPKVTSWFSNTAFENGLSVDQQFQFFLPAILVVSLLLFFLRFLQEYMQENVGEQIAFTLRQRISGKYAHLNFLSTEKIPVGNLAQMFSDDCREIRQTYTRLWGSVPSELILALAHCALLVTLDPQLFVLLLAVLAPAAIVIRVSGKKLKSLARQGIHLQSSLFDLLLEKTKGWESIQSLGRIEREMTGFSEFNQSLFHVWRRATRARSAAQPLVEWLGICAGAAVLVLALRRVSDGALSTPILSAYLMVIASLANSLQGIVGQMNSARKGTECLKRVHRFLASEKEYAGLVSMSEVDTDLNKPSSSLIERNSAQHLREIQVEGYATKWASETAETHFKDIEDLNKKAIHFKAKCGDLVALVGPSGAGKSTFLKSFLGLIPSNNNCQILWNGKSIFNQNVRQTFTQDIAFLPQESYIIPGTILDNLSYPETVSQGDALIWKRALKALESAQLKSRGLNDSAMSLSGGERQRLMFARAFFRDAKLWVMDEATSALDAETERLIARELIETKEQRIVIMVAHRASMIQLSQQVISF